MQKSVADFINKYQLHTTNSIRYIDLVTEIGELGKEIIKSSEYGKKNIEKTPQIADELGDCLFSLLALCHEMDIDAQSILQKSLSKYESRFAQKGDIGSGQ